MLARLARALTTSALILTANVVTGLAAPVPWLDGQVGNGHYYELVVPRGGITWRHANDAASATSFLGNRGHLVTVNSALEWDFITSNFEHSGGTWIGLTDRIVEGQFEWVTGESLEFEAWGRHEPNNAGNEDYVEFHLSDDGWVWNDFRDQRDLHTAERPIGYIVEYPLDRPAGDFEPDNQLTAADIERLALQMQSSVYNPLFDLSADGAVDIDDLRVWIEEVRGSYFGDANLDGEFNSSDFISVFRGGQYEDGVSNNSNWTTGDWNGDFEFDTRDFLIAFQAAGYEAGPRAASAVPEPRVSFLALGLAVLLIAPKPSVSTAWHRLDTISDHELSNSVMPGRIDVGMQTRGPSR